MSLQHIHVVNIRCIEEAELDIPSGLTVISGPNGSGKTSLLEAIFLLGRGRSFRGRNNERLIRHGQDHARVIGQVASQAGSLLTLGVEARREGTLARISGRPVQTLADLSQAFPVQVIEPGVHKLVEEGGRHRRRWLDWAVFHVEPSFVDTWVRYTRALKQRNAALRTQPAHASVWDTELARLGEHIDDCRRRLLRSLEPHWSATVQPLCGLDVELHYLRGWSQDQSLLEALSASRARDEARQVTHVGPHRADVSVRLHGKAARDVLSRGQQKLVAVAMILAPMSLVQEASSEALTLLLDDPAAELDGERLERFIAQVSTLRCQLVVSSLHAESRLFGAPERAFHIAQGRVQPL